MSICDELRAQRKIRSAKPKETDTQRTEYYEQCKAEYKRRKAAKEILASPPQDKKQVVVDLISNEDKPLTPIKNST